MIAERGGRWLPNRAVVWAAMLYMRPFHYRSPPHTLDIGDICGNGHLDLLVGEIGVHQHYAEQPPHIFVYENDGQAHFTRHTIDTGTGTHEGFLADFRRRGVLDIVGKPLHGAEKRRVHVYKHALTT